MSDAFDIDAALATAIESLYPGSYRQQSDVRQDRERVDPTNIAYQLVVTQLTENPRRGANLNRRVFAIQYTIKKHVATPTAERNWRLGNQSTGLEVLLRREFYFNLGLDLVIDDGDPELVDEPETIGRVARYTVRIEAELAY